MRTKDEQNDRGSYRQWRVIRRAILERDRYRCYICGQPANTVDHLVPRSLGGGHEPSNLRACCSFHNTGKHNRTVGIPTTSRQW